MSTEHKSGKKVESAINKSLKAKFKKKCKAGGTSQAQAIRDLIQKWIKED